MASNSGDDSFGLIAISAVLEASFKDSLSCRFLVGGFNPFEQYYYYSSQIGSFPQVGLKIKKYLKPPASSQVSPLPATTVTGEVFALEIHLPTIH